MKSKNLYIIILKLFSCGIVVLFYSCNNSKNKIGFINNKKVFDEFVYTKKLKKEYQLNFELRKKKLDSLMYIINLLERKVANSPEKKFYIELNNRKNQFYELSDNFEKTNEEITNKYDNQIISQMNSYLKEFSNENNLDILLSSDDVGSVVYAKKEIDLTEEAIKYINQKFNSNFKK